MSSDKDMSLGIGRSFSASLEKVNHIFLAKNAYNILILRKGCMMLPLMKGAFFTKVYVTILDN